jgi:DNA-binding response OmpR family regulator
MKDLKALVIDPDFDYLQMLSQFLTADGFHVVTATDGEEGLRKAMIESPDLIIMEPMLSKLHGFTLCNIVTKEFKKKIPVIILTNHYQEPRFKKEALQVYGAAGYLNRPIMKKELRSTIFDVLGKKSMDGVEEMPHPVDPVVEQDYEQEPKKTVAPEAVTENPPAVVTQEPSEITVEAQPEVVREEQVEVEATPNPVKKPIESSGNNGNGSNGKSKVDKMLNDIVSEFGLCPEKKLSNRNHDLQI